MASPLSVPLATEQAPDESTRIALHGSGTLGIEQTGRGGHEVGEAVVIHVDALGRREYVVEHRIGILVRVGRRDESVGRVGRTVAPRNKLLE